MGWPMTLFALSGALGVEEEDLSSDLQRLGVPLHSLAGKLVVYARDLYDAHQRVAEGTNASTRVQHVERIRKWFIDQGCKIEPCELEGLRARDVFRVVSVLDGGEPAIVKLAVCSTVQKGHAVHFNLQLQVLQRREIEFIVLVAPPFLPAPTDFAQRRHDLLRAAEKAGYARKRAYPLRVRPTMTDLLLSAQAARIMETVHGSHSRWQAARLRVEEQRKARVGGARPRAQRKG